MNIRKIFQFSFARRIVGRNENRSVKTVFAFEHFVIETISLTNVIILDFLSLSLEKLAYDDSKWHYLNG